MLYYHSDIYFPEYKIWKIHKNLLKYKSLEKKFNNSLSEVAQRWQRWSIKMLFLKLSQYLQENTRVESLCNKVADLQTCNVIKKKLQQRCFPMNTIVNIAESSRTLFFTIIWKRLFLLLELFCIKNLLILATRILHLTY